MQYTRLWIRHGICVVLATAVRLRPRLRLGPARRVRAGQANSRRPDCAIAQFGKP